jgi:hypothetical protein
MLQRSRTEGARGVSSRYPRPALWTAGVLAVAAAAWLLIGVPRVVKYPADVDARPGYEGTFTLLVNPTTAAPLDEPLALPLRVDRHIEGLPGQSSSSEAVVRETITQKAGQIMDTTQTNQYVMDRSTMLNVADDRAYAFEPANVVDRSGAYRLNLPFGTAPDAALDIYSNEIGATYRMAADTQTPTTEVEGLELLNFTGSVTDAPVTSAYLTELSKSAPLPSALTLEQLKPHLQDAGLDVDALLAALGPRLTPADAATLAAFAADPIPLDYVLSFDGGASVEPVTGAQVVVASNQSVGVRPRPASLPAVQDLLSRYTDVPEAVVAAEVLNGFATGPAIPLFRYSFDQTPASVAEVAGTVASQRRLVQMAEVWLPVALIAGAIVSLVVGGAMSRRRPGTPIDLTAPHETTTETPVPARAKAKAEDMTSPTTTPRP